MLWPYIVVALPPLGPGLSLRFLNEARRHNYVTPTSYLELIKLYNSLLTLKRGEVSKVKSRYENGLDKLRNTAAEVANMQQNLESLKPTLVKAKEDTEEVQKVIEGKLPEVDRLKGIAQKDEAEASKKADEVRVASTTDCEP